ncbi:ABC transporter substrate-binding protein [Microbacterium sp. LWH7-1.2]|uniref:ABC transporter substrate-binding protein n=1 Tax=Microbacterium sp. LWH7-1.2 TaxID=3135257 RepID=UPI0031386742
MSSQSGPLAATGGIPQSNGVRTIVDLINEDGGIDGRQVNLTFVDSAGDAAQAVNNLQTYLSSNDAPDAIFAGQYSFEALALAPITTQAEIFSTSTSVSPEVTNVANFPYTFQVAIPNPVIVEALAKKMADEGYEKVGYIAADDESGRSAVDGFTEVAGEYDLDVVSGFVPTTSVDATAALEAVRAEDPDALIINGTGAVATAILAARTKIGWDVVSYGEGGGFASQDLGVISKPEDWNNLFVQTGLYGIYPSEWTDGEAFESIQSRYIEDYGPIENGFTSQISGTEAILAIKAAYEASDSDEVADLVAALEGLKGEPIPDSISKWWIGPPTFEYDTETHANYAWTPEFFEYTPAGPLVDGMVTP